MVVIPAIDLLDGKVVRLFQGERDRATIYSEDPLAVAQQWQAAGAEVIHIVDLNASFDDGDNMTTIRMLANKGIFLEVGGGIRTSGRAAQLIEAGVGRIILGTKALDRKFLDELLCRYHDRIAVSVDARGGKVATHGWQEATDRDYLDFIQELVSRGVSWIVYTDIAKDGTLEGPSIRDMRAFSRFSSTQFILSGGVGTIDDLVLVRKELPFIYGAIVGKALYEKKIDLSRAIQAV